MRYAIHASRKPWGTIHGRGASSRPERSPHAASPWPALGAGRRPSPITDTTHSSERFLSLKLLHHPHGITAVDTEYLYPGHAASH
ncbi:MAG TPA: hypothetical protein VNY82_09840, partial [Steroidobacteraceae bacterium]|nr:hypothetical protein [Steroidobacteraceae bacterium]